MAARVTSTEINELLDTTRVNYGPYIDIATVLVDEELVGKGMSDARLALIEKFLSAHYVILGKQGGGVARESVGESSRTYRQVKESFQGLTSTNWGQQALAADTTGTLSALGSGGLKAEFRVV